MSPGQRSEVFRIEAKDFERNLEGVAKESNEAGSEDQRIPEVGKRREYLRWQQVGQCHVTEFHLS
jgi:hypothetical protein